MLDSLPERAGLVKRPARRRSRSALPRESCYNRSRWSLAAEASKNLLNASTAPTHWIAAVSAAEENFHHKEHKEHKEHKVFKTLRTLRTSREVFRGLRTPAARRRSQSALPRESYYNHSRWSLAQLLTPHFSLLTKSSPPRCKRLSYGYNIIMLNKILLGNTLELNRSSFLLT